MSKIAFFLLVVFFSTTAKAVDVAGVQVNEKTKVGEAELALTGAGLRKKLFFQVYVIGLYVADPKADPLAQPGAKRVAIQMLRDVDAEDFIEALTLGLRENTTEAELQALAPQVKELSDVIVAIKEAKKGMQIFLDWSGALQVVIDGKAAGRPILGEDFYRALLKIWIGNRPVQDNLKKALLGGRSG